MNKNDLITLVEQSPNAVAVHDKQAWLSLFSESAVVEDPVGSRAVVNTTSKERENSPLANFYDCFIAPNTITFHVDRDLVCGLHVVRDATLEIQMSAALVVNVPMHLLYELCEEQGQFKIQRLAAHWELLPMAKQQLTQGAESLKVAGAMSWRLLRHLGLAGTFGFLAASRSIGEIGKKRVYQFIRALNAGNEEQLGSLVEMDVPCEFMMDNHIRTVRELCAMKLLLSIKKVLAAGDVVSASCSISRTAGSIDGVIMFEFNRKISKIDAMRFYFETEI